MARKSLRKKYARNTLTPRERRKKLNAENDLAFQIAKRPAVQRHLSEARAMRAARRQAKRQAILDWNEAHKPPEPPAPLPIPRWESSLNRWTRIVSAFRDSDIDEDF